MITLKRLKCFYIFLKANNGGVVGKVPKGLNPDESVQDLEEEDEEGQEPEVSSLLLFISVLLIVNLFFFFFS